jgi:CxxC motif-containing protein
MICIVCPRGCHLEVGKEGEYAVAGAGCERGIAYGQKEMQNPTRIITSTVVIQGGIYRRCPVKTASDIPKGLIREAMALLNDVRLQSPVKVGDVAVPDISGSGISWIVTRDM